MHALIATDGSEVSLDAARKAVALLSPTKVTLVSVADTSIAEDSGAGGFEGNLLSPAESERARDAILDEGRDELSLTTAAIGVDRSIVDRRLVEGSAGRAIVHVADEVNPDVVVVGSHGRGFISRVLIGSVSEYVVRHCTHPVLVVRHDDTDDAPTLIPEADTAADAAAETE
jgi:nucleotide-binding universal stress UspA family protein